MLILTSGKLIADGKKDGEKFKLYFQDVDSDHQIRVKDVYSLFDKTEIKNFLDDYSLSLDEFKQLLSLAQNQAEPGNLDRALHKAFMRLQKKLELK